MDLVKSVGKSNKPIPPQSIVLLSLERNLIIDSPIVFSDTVGYDSSNTEYYLFFGQKYTEIKDEPQRESVKTSIRIVLKFISMRRRFWSLIFFCSATGSSTST